MTDFNEKNGKLPAWVKIVISLIVIAGTVGASVAMFATKGDLAEAIKTESSDRKTADDVAYKERQRSADQSRQDMKDINEKLDKILIELGKKQDRGN